ncbi:MAG: hypothetical protein NXI31_02055 [bacterium]|nr:hypothetical protein [bacterium]
MTTTDALTQTLQQNARALRTLAVTLVGPADADDLLQDVALDRLTTTIEPDFELGFARRALRFLAGKRRRQRQFAAEREPRAEPPRVPPTPPDDAARAEAVQRLHEALMALPEPYRGTVMRRFFAAETPSAIAATTATPLPTVKSRLQRGLAILRSHLEARGGRDWRLGLGAAFALPGSRATAATGGVGTSALAVAVLTVVGGGAWLTLGGTGDPAPVVRHADAAVTPPSSADAAVTSAIASRERREPVTAVAAIDEPAAPEFTMARLVGRIVDDAGRGLPDCELRLTPQHSDRSFEPRPHPTVLAAGTTDAGGGFLMRIRPQPFHYWLEVRQAGFGTRLVQVLGRARSSMPSDVPHADAGATIDLGVLQLRRLVRVSGRVLDMAGNPRPGAHVTLTLDGSGPLGIPRHATADSSARFDLLAEPRTYRQSVAGWLAHRGSVQIEPPTTEIIIRTPNDGDIAELCGFTVDPNGRPVADVHVQCVSRLSGSLTFATSDARGRFTLRNTGSRFATEDLTLRVSHPNFDDNELARPARWGERDVRLTLRDRIAVRLEVVAADGTPCRECDVLHRPTASLRSQAPVIEFTPQPLAAVPQEPIRLPRGELELAIRPHDPTRFATTLHTTSITDRDSDPGQQSLALRLRSAAPFAVTVANAADEPIADAWVELGELLVHKATQDTLPCRLLHWPHNRALVGRALAHDAQRTDRTGHTTVHGPVDADLLLRVSASGYLATVTHPLPIDGEGVVRITLNPSRPGTDEARAPPPDEHPVGHVRIQPYPRALLTEFPGAMKVRVFRPEGQPRAVPGDGFTARPVGPAFLANVPTGNWRVECCWARSSWRPVGQVRVLCDTTTDFELDLKPLRPGRLHGTLLCSVPPVLQTGRGHLKWRDQNGKWVVLERIDEDPVTHRFESLLLPGRYRLEFSMGQGQPPWPVENSDFDIVPGRPTVRTFKLGN